MIPTEVGCGVTSGGISAARAVVPRAGVGARIPGADTRVSEAGVKMALLRAECCYMAGGFLDALRKYSALWGGPTLALASWRATSEMRSAQWAAEPKLPSG
jgi:hypothetical protein